MLPLLTQLRDLDLGRAPECMHSGLAQISNLQVHVLLRIHGRLCTETVGANSLK